MQDPAKCRVQELKQQPLKSPLCSHSVPSLAESSWSGLAHAANPSQQTQDGKPWQRAQLSIPVSPTRDSHNNPHCNPRAEGSPHPARGSFTPLLTQRGGKARARGGKTGQGLRDLGKEGAHRHHPCSAPRAEVAVERGPFPSPGQAADSSGRGALLPLLC